MEKTPENTVAVSVLKVKDKPFYAVVGPGGIVLSAFPVMDGATGSKDMTKHEIYKEYENILMLDKHITDPDHYELRQRYLSPDNLEMLVKLDMRRRTVEEMADVIKDSTRV